MSKNSILVVFIFFIIYMISSLIFTIPTVVNNIVMGICSLGAIIYIIFYTNIGQKIKSDLSKNIKKEEE